MKGFPTFVVADAEGAPIDTWAGYEKNFLLGHLSEAREDLSTIYEKTVRFKSEPNERDGRVVARYHATRGDYGTALSYVEAVAKVPGAADVSAERFAYTADHYLRAEKGTAEDVKGAADAALAGSPDAETMINIASSMKRVGRKSEDISIYVPYIEPVMTALAEAPEDDEYAKSVHSSLEVDHALYVAKDLDRAVDLKRATYPEGWQDDAGRLNSFAWWCFENNVNLEEAEALARRGVELAAAGSEKANLLDTAAEICNARGNCDDAVELMRQAVDEDPDREYFQEQLKRFEQLRENRM